MSPLVIVNGMIRQLGNDRGDIPLLNIGAPELLSITSNTTTRTRNVVNLVKGTPGGGNIDLHTIDGDVSIGGNVEGDILIAFGTAVKLKRNGGNLTGLDSDFTLQPGKSITLYFWSGAWQELCRRA